MSMDFYFGIDLLQRLRQYYESRLAQALSKGFDQPGAQYYWLFQELEHRASTLRRLMAMLDVCVATISIVATSYPAANA